MKKTIATVAVAAIMAIGSTTSFANTLIDQGAAVSNATVSLDHGFAIGGTIAANVGDVSRCEFTSIEQGHHGLEFTNVVKEDAFAVNGAASGGMVMGNALNAGQGQAIQLLGSN